MALNVAVQMDPIDKINIAGDSTFALLLEARARGHRLSYYTPDKLSLRDGRVVAKCAPVEVRDVEGDHFTLGGAKTSELGLFDVVLLRQDPPFDLAYITATHLLEHLQPRVLIVNDPASVRNAPEKLFVMNFPELMPPTLITRDREAIEAFLNEHYEAVMKPLHGHGGAAVFKIARRDPNFGSLFDLFAATFREPWVVQRFLPRVANGDKRIVLVDGVPVGAVNRVPAGNDIRANLARGASAAAAELTPREREICAVIGPELKRRGLLFAGIDVIDGNLTEINVTSPTGIRAIKRLGGPDLAVAIWDAIEAKLRRGEALSFVESGNHLARSARDPSIAGPSESMNAMLETASPVPLRRQRINLPQGAYFPGAGLRAKIAALHAGGEPAQVVRQQTVAFFRTALDQGRALARETFQANGGGLACASHLAHIEDELIREIFNYVTSYVHPAANGPAGEAFVIVAVGGYGRATLAPGSDVDLLFLLSPAARPRGERIAEAILYMLWDLGQKVGHSTRMVKECLVNAREDMTVRTALLDARLILGDSGLFETMRTRFEREIVQGRAAEFVAAKLAERDSRIAQAGRSRYLVEPNVKDGKGGLRDLNTLFWIAKYVYRLREAADLIGAGVFSRSEYKLFCRCEEFLWRVRSHLHFLTGRAEERLSFDHQRRIADLLGYSTRGGLASVERFMKHYFLIAKDVGDLTAIVCAALEEKQAKPKARLDRFRPWRRKRATIETGDFEVENGRVTVAGPEAFSRDPVNLIRLFWVADRNGLAIHPDATRHVTLALKRIDAKLRADPEANRLFLDILTSRNEPEIVLRLMNEAGVLGRFVPEFGRIVALVQFNMYHHYTVDEHILRAVGNLAEIGSRRLAADHPLATDILLSIGNRRALILALFLHDIAKGRVEDHSAAGVDVARALCPRLGLTEAETETVAWLVENHLVMSDIAQRRDLGDPKTIATFASRVQTLERLKMLLVLTICDIRAVGPGVWNNWKAELLRTLYWETEVELSGGHSTTDRKQRVARGRAELRRALPKWSDLDFEAYAARLPQAYWLKATLEQKLLHAKLLNMTEVEIPAPMTNILVDRDRSVTELTVIAPDHVRLLSTVAGACAATGANIVDAQVFTTADGLALDTIFVSRAFKYDEDELRRAGSIVLAIERALSGQVRLRDMVAARTRAAGDDRNVFRIHPEVSIDNTLSNRFTVVEVAGLDRPGLLYELTAIMTRLSLNIASAHIATFGEKAADVFYVTDLTGEKITSAHRQEAIGGRF